MQINCTIKWRYSVSQPFYRETEDNIPIEDLKAFINRKLDARAVQFAVDVKYLPSVDNSKATK